MYPPYDNIRTVRPTYGATAQASVVSGAVGDLINVNEVVPGAQSEQRTVRREFHHLDGNIIGKQLLVIFSSSSSFYNNVRVPVSARFRQREWSRFPGFPSSSPSICPTRSPR